MRVTFRDTLTPALDEMKKQLQPSATDKRDRKAEKKFAERLLAEIRRRAPKDTGEYAKSWHIEERRDGFYVVTDDSTLYDILEYTGSVPHDIYPRYASVLHWIDRDTGQDRYAAHVRHPGFKPIPHVRPALRAVQKRAAKEAEAEFARGLER